MAKRWAANVAEKSKVPVFAVDAACSVAMNALPKLLTATKAFRAAHRPLRESSLVAMADRQPTARKFTGKLCFEADEIADFKMRKLDSLIRRCDVDMTLGPTNGFRGHRAAALKALKHAIKNIIPRYKWTRNNPALDDSTSKLSPYMRFGVLGPREAAVAIGEADMHSAARWKFLDELLTWREYYYHLARHADDASAYANVPAWGRNTLDTHRDDEREEIYSLDDLVHGRTSDPTWNAAQLQFLNDGWMHNNLRMYWVKQIIKWTKTPESAWATAVYLNDRLSLDGREPSTYGGIQWGFGRSKRGYKEIPIYGWVPTKSDRALRRREGVIEWIEKQNRRESISITVPSSLDE